MESRVGNKATNVLGMVLYVTSKDPYVIEMGIDLRERNTYGISQHPTVENVRESGLIRTGDADEIVI
jgi:hypothetical protein